MRRGHSKRAPMGMNPVQKLIINILLPMWAGQPYLRGFSTLTPHHVIKIATFYTTHGCYVTVELELDTQISSSLWYYYDYSVFCIFYIFSVWSFTSGNAANSYKIWTFLYGCQQNCLFTQNHPWRFEPFLYHGRHCFFRGGKADVIIEISPCMIVDILHSFDPVKTDIIWTFLFDHQHHRAFWRKQNKTTTKNNNMF